jgi:hypothetical protein
MEQTVYPLESWLALLCQFDFAVRFVDPEGQSSLLVAVQYLTVYLLGLLQKLHLFHLLWIAGRFVLLIVQLETEQDLMLLLLPAHQRLQELALPQQSVGSLHQQRHLMRFQVHTLLTLQEYLA